MKTCSKSTNDAEDMKNFVREAQLMKRLDHPNVIKLLGVCLQDQPLRLITEFMEHGDLKDYLRRHPDVRTPRLLQMSKDVAEGLWYLANTHK